MTKNRILSQKNKYYIPKEEFLTVYHYCRQYPLWIQELKTIPDATKGISYDEERVKSSGNYNPTEDLGMRRHEIEKKKGLIDEVASTTAPELCEWLILGCCYGVPYYQLNHKGIPCGKDMYYDRRRRFYYELSKRI